MTPPKLLQTLAALGVILWPEGDQLRFQAPGGTLTPELRAALAEHKAEILAILTPPPRLPYIDARGDLVVPFDAPAPSRWWDPAGGGEPLADVLVGLGADPEVIRRYTEAWLVEEVLERAAVREFDGGQPRDLADRAAQVEIAARLRH